MRGLGNQYHEVVKGIITFVSKKKEQLTNLGNTHLKMLDSSYVRYFSI